jgi:hypothetical protein
MFTDLSLQVALGLYHVHRTHFTGRPSGLEVMGSCNVY